MAILVPGCSNFKQQIAVKAYPMPHMLHDVLSASANTVRLLALTLLLAVLAGCQAPAEDPGPSPEFSGTMMRWHPVTLTFDGPETSEDATTNPFLDYRLMVTFTHEASGQFVIVPGYFAADGNAGETGAASGHKWRVHFTPHEIGQWTYAVSFQTGDNVAINLDPLVGEPVFFDRLEGAFTIAESNKTGRDFRGKGVLRYVGERYLRFDNGDYFVKAGADSPENLLAYSDFDNTVSLLARDQEREGEAPTSPLHHYTPHVGDWNSGDPVWHGEKGKGLIGALNYLAGKGMNVFSFLTMNVEGDGQDVWPWVLPEDPLRFDVSKLAQWEVVFSHADSLGLFLHFKTQETENDLLLDGGNLDVERKLYYRELIARFGHHLALNWNLGEENDIWDELGDPTQERIKAYIEYIHALDAYDHPVVIHTYPNQHDEVYGPLLGRASELDGLSIQTAFDNVHAATLKWVAASSDSPRTWVVSNDEQGPHTHGVKPDGPDSNRDAIRKETLWGNLMAGGAGVEYYFGYQFPPHDLNANDWRTRDTVWEDARHALDFFYTYVPFWTMTPADDLASGNAWVLADPGRVYAVYLPEGGTTRIAMEAGAYDVAWYNPRTGGELQGRSSVTAGASLTIGPPPAEQDADWAVLITAQ